MGQSSTATLKLLREAGVVDLAIYRDVALRERALSGDVEACIEWLSKHRHDPRLRKALKRVKASSA